MMNNLRRLDLNQLLTLQALLREKHVSRAAQSLHKSQPTVSHTLNQLRDLFQDPLLVRENGQYSLSSKAEALYLPLTEALNQLDSLISQSNFQPENCQRRFNIAMSDYGATILTPNIIQRLRKQAPLIDLQIWQSSREEMQIKLLEGSLDIAFGVFNHIPFHLKSQTIFDDPLISVTDQRNLTNNNLNQQQMSLEQWLAHPHILVSMKPYEANEIDHYLEQHNYQRRIAITLPYWQLSTQLLTDNDLILTVASKAIDSSLADNLRLFTPPLPLPLLKFQMLWHSRSEGDAALQWLREQFNQIMVSQSELA